MKKLIVLFMIGMILLTTVGIVFAESMEDSIKENLGEKGKEVINITEVTGDLPDEIIIGDNNPNINIYEIDVGETKPIFAITYSGEGEGKKEETIIQEKHQFLNFGFSGEMNDSGFLKTSTGVQGDLKKGYVMMRKGSITAISTNLEILDMSNSGHIEIIIYKNGEPIGFRNTLNAISSGIKKDYDIQSENTVIFEPGDVISVYVKTQEDTSWEDVITIVEITI